MNAGDTFRFSSARHTWIVVSDPSLNASDVVIANVTSNKAWQDQSCLITKGEHECAHSVDVVVYYAKAQRRSNSELDAMLSAGQIRLGAPIGSELLSRIRAGAERSTQIPFDVRQVLVDQGIFARPPKPR